MLSASDGYPRKLIACNEFATTTMVTHVVIAFDGYPRMHVACNDDDGKPCRHSDRRLPADTVAESYTCMDKYGIPHVLMSQR